MIYIIIELIDGRIVDEIILESKKKDCLTATLVGKVTLDLLNSLTYLYNEIKIRYRDNKYK